MRALFRQHLFQPLIFSLPQLVQPPLKPSLTVRIVQVVALEQLVGDAVLPNLYGDRRYPALDKIPQPVVLAAIDDVDIQQVLDSAVHRRQRKRHPTGLWTQKVAVWG